MGNSQFNNIIDGQGSAKSPFAPLLTLSMEDSFNNP